ncbi:MAG: hypothetical protein EXR72_20330 [Myxococcales bacterium]|nr:hypothetical protein [Myxococcales bacterium]
MVTIQYHDARGCGTSERLEEVAALLASGAQLWIDAEGDDGGIATFLAETLKLHPLAVEEILQGAPEPGAAALPRPDDLAGPDNATRQRRLSWAVLMRRTWGLAVLVCPRCSGPMDLIAAIEDADVARRILTHLGLPARAPPRGRPWRRQLLLDQPRTCVDDAADPPSQFE